ncbi:MAG TPA: GNAT family N-acetyltransferase [Desulfomonilaceae bacterium]|nr:GNAT family N-acetyltransferase [Desulfomonilaceae bacterium]
MTVEIRPARREDAGFLSWVIYTAGTGNARRGIWDILIGASPDECLLFLELLTATEKRHLFHWSCFLIAESETRPVAALGGYDWVVLGYDALREAIPEVLEQIGVPEFPDHEHSNRILDCIPESLKGAWIIESVATLPAFRRRGIVDTLLDKMLERGRNQGFSLAQINILIGNSPAQAAYEKHGFRVLDEKRDRVFEEEVGSPGMLRLVKNLRE